MSSEPVTYKHDLGEGLYLTAFAIDPEINRDKLRAIVSSLDGKPNDLEALSGTIVRTDRVRSIQDLQLEPVSGAYKVPKPLERYRRGIKEDWDKKGRFNGPVLIATGEIVNPLKVIQGGYYDYAATKLTDEPAKLLPEDYPAGKIVEDILNDNGIDLNQRARYFGFSHLMWPSNGKEFLLVQRAKGMGIAGDCISTPGSTVDVVLNSPRLKKSRFSIRDYWSYHFAEEMKDEFNLRWGDFWTGVINLFDDKKMIPFGAINIITELSTEEIARRAFGDPRILKEHTVLYSMQQKAIPTLLQRYPIFPSVAKSLDIILKKE